MALQDLTPQLRTRLSRMERAVGWFVVLATLLLAAGFAYYVYNTAQRKGWFTRKFKYQTSLNNAAGIKVGDPVKLMGFNVGQITEIIPNEPDAYYGVTINFFILKPHYGYVWDDSVVKISSDFLGSRFVEISKGAAGIPTIDESTNRVPQAMLRSQVIREARKGVIAGLHARYPDMARTNADAFGWYVKDELQRITQADRDRFFTNLSAIYWIPPEESPALNERLERLANQIEAALPNILDLTNKLAKVLDNTSDLTANLNAVALDARPVVSNLALATAGLDRPGGLGDWLLPTNINQTLGSVMDGADTLMANANTNLANLNLSLIHLANITSNLNNQVQANSNMLSAISQAVQDADDLVQGLKRHWLLRSAFKTKTEGTRPPRVSTPVLSPKERSQQPP